MINRISSKDYLKNLNSLRFYCIKYIWDLPEWLRKSMSLFLIELDKEILDEKLRIQKYKEKQERMQITIYDLSEDK